MAPKAILKRQRDAYGNSAPLSYSVADGDATPGDESWETGAVVCTRGTPNVLSTVPGLTVSWNPSAPPIPYSLSFVNGLLVNIAFEYRFEPSASIQTFTVPAGWTAVQVFLWGAGGGGGGVSEFSGGESYGGGGGYTSGVLSVTPGQVLSLIVGTGGLFSPAGSGVATGGYEGGGASGEPSTGGPVTGGCGSGGGRTCIRDEFGNELCTAGGGGGGSQVYGAFYQGGGGGGDTGQDGSSNVFSPAQGGQPGNGGSGASAEYSGANGEQYVGGSVPSGVIDAGGGGAGWYGGGSGGANTSTDSYSSGAGGSGYTGSLSSAITLTADGRIPPETSSPAYPATAPTTAYGGLSRENGNGGYVVIRPVDA